MIEFIYIATAAKTTIILALCALVIGLILAITFAVLESVRWRCIALISTGLVTLLRGLPEILVVLFVYFGTSQLLSKLANGINIQFSLLKITIILPVDNLDISPFICGVIALALLYASYASQILLGAVKAIPYGQWESGQALGMSDKTLFCIVILPQIWRYALPGLGNQWLVLLKDTALVSLISVNDLMFQTKNIISFTHQPFTWYMVAGSVYLIITLISQVIIHLLKAKTFLLERRSSS